MGLPNNKSLFFPDILLLDEPTTGLDSFTARHLVSSLQSLARQGKIIVMSLHQPRSDIVKLLDQSVIMSQGHVAYFGPTNEMVPYFTELGYPCPTYANPLDTYSKYATGMILREGNGIFMNHRRQKSRYLAYRDSSALAGGPRYSLSVSFRGFWRLCHEHISLEWPEWLFPSQKIWFKLPTR